MVGCRIASSFERRLVRRETLRRERGILSFECSSYSVQLHTIKVAAAAAAADGGRCASDSFNSL